MSGEAPRRLASWKEIAQYLRREVRTVIRWEKERGLPVHRVPGGQGRSVFAFTDELDEWASGSLSKPAEPRRPRMKMWVAAGVGTLLIAAAAARAVTAWPGGDIVALDLTSDSLAARNAAGRALWTYHFPERLAPPNGIQDTAVVDLTGDAHPDAVVTVLKQSRRDVKGTAVLYAIDSRGRELWQQSLADSLRFENGTFAGPWQPEMVDAFVTHGQPRITWAVHHYTWWPSMLTTFDARGHRLGTFVNAGWILSSDATADGRALIAGGFSNSRNGAAFAILDADRPSGASPEDPGSPYACRSCPAGSPLRYIVVPWTDIATVLPPDERSVGVVNSPDGGVELSAQQRANTAVILQLSPSLEVTAARVSDTFWEWHRRLEEQGVLKHDRAHCPFRDGPIVREWTPANGWREIR